MSDKDLYIEKYESGQNIDKLDNYNIDLWKIFIEGLKSKGIEITEDYMNIEKFFALDSNDELFDIYMKTSIKSILVKMTNLMHKAINKFEVGMESLDEKSIFVIMDKLTTQIKILNEMYNKTLDRKGKNSESDFVLEKI